MAPHSREARTVADSKEDKTVVGNEEHRMVISGKEDGDLTLTESPQSAESTSGCNGWMQVLLSIQPVRRLTIR